MMPFSGLEVEFFEQLKVIDERLSATVAAARCRHCGGPLHRANYPRKPRGGLLCGAGEGVCLRQSLCCGRRGCRKRALPPSMLFLGRRVYLGAVLVMASAMALLETGLHKAAQVSGAPARTLVRWHAWWTSRFLSFRGESHLTPWSSFWGPLHSAAYGLAMDLARGSSASLFPPGERLRNIFRLEFIPCPNRFWKRAPGNFPQVVG
jgi:hypothetical protein